MYVCAFLGRFCSFWVILCQFRRPFGSFGFFRVILAFFGRFGVSLNFLVDHFWVVLTCFGLFWLVLNCFVSV